MNLQSSTLKFDESGKPFHIQQAEQIRVYRDAWKAAGHTHEPRVSVSRSIFALVNDMDRAYFGAGRPEADQFGYIEPEKRAIARAFSAAGIWPWRTSTVKSRNSLAASRSASLVAAFTWSLSESVTSGQTT